MMNYDPFGRVKPTTQSSTGMGDYANNQIPKPVVESYTYNPAQIQPTTFNPSQQWLAQLAQYNQQPTLGLIPTQQTPVAPRVAFPKYTPMSNQAMASKYLKA